MTGWRGGAEPRHPRGRGGLEVTPVCGAVPLVATARVCPVPALRVRASGAAWDLGTWWWPPPCDPGGLRRATAQGSPLLRRMLRNNRISCIHNDSFTGLRNVRLLSLYDNQITTISPGAFDTLQALSTL